MRIPLESRHLARFVVEDQLLEEHPLAVAAMFAENQSQFTACSGKRPVCLKDVG